MGQKQNCRALIVYRPPDHFTAIEAATFNHGTHAERLAVIESVCMRSFGVPASLLASDATNYSSKSADEEAWKRRWNCRSNTN